ncbi:MAG TPA: isoprenylcysteine carboxylmethyltransferase family protein [Thermoleophilaceae bacterium]|nr:isoprenylcysteine carboxylmethyltransferase family protein [Thermoleophilaceae bacterium]
MTRVRAALGSLLFLFVAPGVVTVLVPYWLTRFESNGPPAVLVVAGALLVVAGAAVLLHAFARFVVEGIGTPAPVAPTEQLVIGGAYRYVRNPMYLAVGSVILGEALLLGQPVLLVWLALFGAAVAAFVLLYEEPTLGARYGDEYAAYCESVPRWLPKRPRADRDPARYGRRVSP